MPGAYAKIRLIRKHKQLGNRGREGKKRDKKRKTDERTRGKHTGDSHPGMRRTPGVPLGGSLLIGITYVYI